MIEWIVGVSLDQRFREEAYIIKGMKGRPN